jgi:hypothetical protein
MLADNRADGASGICEPATSDPTVVVDVDDDDVAECDRGTSFTADGDAVVAPHPDNAHTTTTAIMIAGRAGCLEIITRSMTPCKPVRFHLGGTRLAEVLRRDEFEVVEPAIVAPALKKRYSRSALKTSSGRLSSR